MENVSSVHLNFDKLVDCTQGVLVTHTQIKQYKADYRGKLKSAQASASLFPCSRGPGEAVNIETKCGYFL